MSAPKIKMTGTLVGDEELVANLKDLGELAMAKNLVSAAQAGALLIVNAAKNKAPKKTRTLARSLHHEVEKATKNYVELNIGTNLEYAAMQEFGGTVVPKKAKFLAIPANSGAEAVGSPLNYPGKLRAIITGFSGVMVDEAGTVQYVLTKSATIPAHPYLRPAFDEQRKNVFKAVGDYFARLMESLIK